MKEKGQNEMWQLKKKNDIGVGVKSSLWVRVELMAW